jgi:AmmeMemoRadiSam system protein A
MNLTDEEKELLRKVAKGAIEAALSGKMEETLAVTETLKKKAGAFVTLKKHGELRGCIGYTRDVTPLWETVKSVAVQSAFHDPRFPGIDAAEWGDIDMEISVITPMQRIKDVDEIEVGKHGLYIEQGGRSGLLLPQVAVEYEWDSKAFLEFTCLKAGLPRDAWKSKDAKVYSFTAEIF